MKRKILLVQQNSVYGDSIYLPYAIGSLAAFAFNDERIRENYEISGIVYKKESVSETAKTYKDIDVVAFSCYVWNYEYSKALARELKRINPECIIIFGGHQINADSDIIVNTIADYVILGEGDLAFRSILLAICGYEDADNIPNIYHNNGLALVFTHQSPVSIPQRVSPYVSGLFDDIIQSEKELKFSAILETNRGCPNKCAFCDWGNIKARVIRFSRELVKAEIEWFALNHIEYCYCADANFGLFKEDFETVDYLIEMKNTYGYPEKFQATYSKNNPEVVFELNKRLNNAGMAKGATLSFQSLSETALENINRKNLKLDAFRHLMKLYHANGISTYSEVILGLPGETLKSFKLGIEELLESGQHMSINCFNCELLANSPMNAPEYILEHKIEWVKCEQHQYHTKKQAAEIQEYSNIVVSTKDLPRRDWVACNIFVVFVRALHNMGPLQCFAIFLHNERNLSYTKFYDIIIAFAKNNPDTVCGEIYGFLMSAYDKVIAGCGTLSAFDPKFGDITWPFDEFCFLKASTEIDRFYKELRELLHNLVEDEDIFFDLLRYQNAIIKLPGDKDKVLVLKYNWYDYFDSVYSGNVNKLKKENNTIKIKCPNIPESISEYTVNVIWYGRKGGQNIYSDIEYIEQNPDK